MVAGVAFQAAFVPEMIRQGAVDSADSRLTALLPDLLFNMMSYLSLSEIAALGASCRSFSVLIKDNAFWRTLFNRRFLYSLPALSYAEGACMEAYKAKYLPFSNITNGVYSLCVLVEHQSTVCHVSILDGQLFSASNDNVIRMWELESGKNLKAFMGHEQNVYSVAIAQNELFLSFMNGTISVCSLENGENRLLLKRHQGGVGCLTLFKDQLASGSLDNTIKIWDLTTGNCVRTLEGHQNGVSCLIAFEDVLISGSDDCTIKVWNPVTGECLKTLEGHQGGVRSLILSGGLLLSGSDDYMIRIWDLKRGECLTVLEGHSNTVCSLAVSDNLLFSGSNDNRIRIWDLNRKVCLNTLTGHTGSVRSLAVFGNKLVSGSSDYTIRIWDFGASDRVIFEEIADLLGSERLGAVAEAMERFSRMPQREVREIYAELEEENGYSFDQRAVRGDIWWTSPHWLKSQAILNYLHSNIKNAGLFSDCSVM